MGSVEFDELKHNSAKPEITPTKADIDYFCAAWLERKAKAMGVEFVLEALNEGEEPFKLYAAYMDGARSDAGYALHEAVERYWLPSALKAAESADWNAIYRERQE